MPRRGRPHKGPRAAIGQRLRRLSEWAVASCLTAAFGCTNEGPAVVRQALLDSPLRQVPCGDLLLAADPIKPARAYDYLGVYAPSAHSPNQEVLMDFGDPCATASDQASCLAQLAAILATPSDCTQDMLICRPFAVTTHGDEVLRHDQASTLAKVLGSVDTHSEAVLLAQLYGLHVDCGLVPLNPLQPGTRVQATNAGYHVESKWDRCSQTVGEQSIDIQRDGSSTGLDIDMVTRSGCASGRRPAGLLLSAATSAREPVGAYLADCARLEAASVHAFRGLARELDRLGAATLASSARRSAREEVRHAAQMHALARRYGARPSTPRVAAAQRLRPAFEIAQENAVEGCVRETFGALLAWQQSACAADPAVARTMRGIAADETRHAELAWEVAAWLEPKLSARERLTVQRARHRALEELHTEIATDPLPLAARKAIGWPTAAQQSALLDRLATELMLS